jgi:prolipoprotein diacylglyceryl transferase
MLNLNTVLGAVHWNPDAVAFRIFGWPVMWYGVLWVTGIYVGYFVLQLMYRHGATDTLAKKEADKELNSLAIPVILGALLGARLGHVFFYNKWDVLWDNYLTEPWNILNFREGGMASHGGTIGMLLGLLWFRRKYPHRKYLWVADRVAVASGFGAMCIRLGNLLNSEIVGRETGSDWGFIFVGASGYSDAARHPVVLYEAISYLVFFAVMLWLYFRVYKHNPPLGRLAGVFLVLVFTARFVLEFFKTPQEHYEQLIPGLTTGQLLSIPAVLGGLYIIWHSRRFAAKHAGTSHS